SGRWFTTRRMIAGGKRNPTISSESTNSVIISWLFSAGRRLTPPCRYGALRKPIMTASSKRSGAWLTAAVVAFCIAVGSTSACAADSERIRVGVTHTPGAGPLFIAAERYFASEGLDVRIEFLPSDMLVATRVASGELDIGLAELDGPLLGYAAK